MRRTRLPVLALAVLLAAAPVRAEEAAEAAARDRLAAGVAALRTSAAGPGAAFSAEFQLYALGEALAAAGQTLHADQFRRYLAAYYPKSPLCALLPAKPEDVLPLEYFDPDPEVVRLVRTTFERYAASPSGPADADLELGILNLAAGESRMPLPPAGTADLLDAEPSSPWAGWLSLQLLWARRLLDPVPDGGEAFTAWAAAHPDHPLAAEAREAASLRWVAPLDMARRSALLPGWGEDTLEPGAREGSSALYSELLLAAGAIGFTISAQSVNRTQNLTAALVLYNLLFLNHKGSAENAYAGAMRYNLGQRRKFVTARRDRPILGAGVFTVPPEDLAPPPEPVWSALLTVGYRRSSTGDTLRGTGWVREEELQNLGVRLEALAELTRLTTAPEFEVVLGAAPYVRGFSTHAGPSEGSPLTQGADAAELGAGAEAALLARLGSEESWWQARLSLGPGVRWRRLDAPPVAYAGTGAVATAMFALGNGGKAASWQIGFAVDDGFATVPIESPGRPLTVPAEGWELFGGLGASF
jgi:hypothetical protein